MSREYGNTSFSPRNGVVILKKNIFDLELKFLFQSPQWGSNSKDYVSRTINLPFKFQSPQWGSNSKGQQNLINSKS